jgi:hypothetical protein
VWFAATENQPMPVMTLYLLTSACNTENNSGNIKKIK